MKQYSVAEFKAQFSEVLSEIFKGKDVLLSFGKRHKKVAVMIPYQKYRAKKRTLGILNGQAKIGFAKDFKMTEEDWLNH